MTPKILGAPEFIGLVVVRDGTSGDPGAGDRRNCEKLFKRRRASESRHGDVFLVLGDLYGYYGEVRFEDLAEVTWASERVFDSDLCYRPVRWR